MTSVKLKLRTTQTKGKGKERFLFFQLIHNRVVRQVKTDYKIFPTEWDETSGEIILPEFSNPRFQKLSAIIADLKWEEKRILNIDDKLNVTKQGKYSVVDVVNEYRRVSVDKTTVFDYMHGHTQQLLSLGQIRTSETCKSALRSFMKFRENEDLNYTMMTDNLIQMYAAWLKQNGVSKNTSSFYMRQLRVCYNLAVENDLTEDKRPFRHVYTGIDKTVKRAISLADMRRLKSLNLVEPHLVLARDMFLMSFYLRGMSFVDMAYLRKKDLVGGTILYRRRKTDQPLEIGWEKKMQEILASYDENPTQYLLPIILKEDGTERTQYLNAMTRINRALKAIGEMTGIKIPLTMYVARHSWASIARNMKIGLPIISRGLGHDSEATTQIYLEQIRRTEVDKANRKILRGL